MGFPLWEKTRTGSSTFTEGLKLVLWSDCQAFATRPEGMAELDEAAQIEDLPVSLRAHNYATM